MSNTVLCLLYRKIQLCVIVVNNHFKLKWNLVEMDLNFTLKCSHIVLIFWCNFAFIWRICLIIFHKILVRQILLFVLKNVPHPITRVFILLGETASIGHFSSRVLVFVCVTMCVCENVNFLYFCLKHRLLVFYYLVCLFKKIVV